MLRALDQHPGQLSYEIARFSDCRQMTQSDLSTTSSVIFSQGLVWLATYPRVASSAQVYCSRYDRRFAKYPADSLEDGVCFQPPDTVHVVGVDSDHLFLMLRSV